MISLDHSPYEVQAASETIVLITKSLKGIHECQQLPKEIRRGERSIGKLKLERIHEMQFKACPLHRYRSSHDEIQ
jgi:hypothetical protein